MCLQGRERYWHNHCGRPWQKCGDNRYISCGCCTFAITVTITFIGLFIAFLAHFPGSKLSTYDYSAGDTRIITYSSTYCQTLTTSDTANSSLYLLKRKPPLSGPVNNITIYPTTNIEPDTYQYRSLHLYTGSKMNMRYCLYQWLPSSAISFFLIKGNENLRKWKYDKNSSHSQISITIENPCSAGTRNQLYNFTSTDYYFFVFDNPNQETDLQVEALIMLNRTEYIITDNNTFDKCDHCTVPYWSHYIALLHVDSPAPIPYTTFSIDVICEPRVWLYVLIVLIPFLFLVVTIFSLSVLCHYIRHRRPAYSTLTAAHPSVNTTSSASTSTFGSMSSSAQCTDFAAFEKLEPSSEYL